MPVYEVSLRRGGRIVNVNVVARTPGEAAHLARSDGGVIVSQPKLRRSVMGAGITPAERYILLYQLAVLTDVGNPLTDSLRILRGFFKQGRMQKCIAQLELGVAAGRQLADLIAEDKINFPGAVGLMVKSGSKGAGGMVQALKQAAEFEREIMRATTRGVKGLWNAAIWVIVGTVGILACPIWLTPYLKNSQLFQLLESPVSWNWLDVVSWVAGGLLLVLMLIALALFFVIVVGQRVFPMTSDRIVMAIPYLKEIVFARDNFIALQRFSVMIKAGVSLEETIETTWKDIRRGQLKSDLALALQNVKSGRNWTDGMKTLNELDKVVLRLATDKEKLASSMEQTAEQNKRLYITRLESLEPVLSLTGGFAMIALYAIIGLYSIVPFAELFRGLLDMAYGAT